MFKVHQEKHPNAEKRILLSWDGVQKDKSSGVKLDVFSLRFYGCARVYPISVIKVLTKQSKLYSHESYLKPILEELR